MRKFLKFSSKLQPNSFVTMERVINIRSFLPSIFESKLEQMGQFRERKIRTNSRKSVLVSERVKSHHRKKNTVG